MKMMHPIKSMKHKHHMKFMRHKKQEKCLAILTLAALGTLTAVNIMHLRESMKQKRSTGGIQDKIEHFQQCFERLMEHS